MSESRSEQTIESLESKLRQTARHFPFPPTPDIAGSLQTHSRRAARPISPVRRWAGAALIVVALTAILLGVPPVRAAVIEFLRLGAVRIFLIEPTPTATNLPTATPPQTSRPAPPPTSSPVPAPTATPLASLLDLAGETSLVEAQAQVDFPIRLPAEPLDLGPPDRVYLQEFEGPLVVLVWLEPDTPGQVQLSLHLLGPNTFAGKGGPETVEETAVHGQPALWVTGPHMFWLRDGQPTLRRLVEGNTLIWTEGEITYRLETDLSLSEAVKIAESVP